MKNILPLIFVIAFVSRSQAQVRLSPVLGLNLAKQNIKLNGESVSTGSKKAAHFGIILDVPIRRSFHFMPGIFYTGKGTIASFQLQNGAPATLTETVNYIEVPLNVAYWFGTDGGLFLYAGPYVGYGLNARSKLEAGAQSWEEDVKFGEEPGMYDRMDVGFNIGLGYQLPLGIFLRTQFGTGLTDIASEADGSLDISNQAIGFSIGYFFNR